MGLSATIQPDLKAVKLTAAHLTSLKGLVPLLIKSSASIIVHMSRPFKLFRLQQIDSHIDWINTRLQEIEKSISDDSNLRAVEAKLDHAEGELSQARKVLKSAEYETQQLRIKIEQTEASLYGGKVRNPKELQDLQNETAALKRHMNVLEERQFEAMLSEEEKASAVALRSQEQNEAKSAHEQKLEELNLEKSKLLKDLSRSENEREASIGSIEQEDISAYQQLRLKRRGIAVSKVVDRACSACGTTLNSTLLNASHSPNQVHFCDNCGRILYSV